MNKAIQKQRKDAQQAIINAYKSGATINEIAKMRLKQNNTEKAQKALFGI